MTEQLYNHIRSLVTMNDAQFSEFAIGTGAPMDAYAALTTLVNDGRVIMTAKVDATGRTIGGVYSLPTNAQAVR